MSYSMNTAFSKAQAAHRVATAFTVDVTAIEQAFQRAMVNDVKTPKLRLGEFVFKRAPDTGRNPGAIYVTTKAEGTYLGKVLGGKFLRIRECTYEQEKAVVEACTNPAESAIAYGKRVGECAICGRRLDNSESIDRGIGPICAENYGF